MAIWDGCDYRYLARLSKKSKKGNFGNFACSEINWLLTSKSKI